MIRSRFIPKALGFMLIAAGAGYLTTSVTAIVLPDYRSLVTRLVMPLYFGELPIIFWLLIKGARPREELDSASGLRAEE